MLPRLVCLLIGLLIGHVQTAYIFGKIHHKDIRTEGSGNAGATNTLRVFGTKAGILVFVCDMAKSVIAILITMIIFRDSELLFLLKIYTGLGCVIGHDFPVYMGFRGGKGVACTAGTILMTDWRLAIICAILFIPTFLISHYVSLGSMLMAAGYFVGTVVLGLLGAWKFSGSLLIELYIITGIISFLCIWNHRSNIVRLFHGKENKTFLSKKKHG